MKKFRRTVLSLSAMALCAAAVPARVLAVQPDEVLSDPLLEKRAREISAELRCLVCQNQSIDDSDAPLAGDLRRLVRERLKASDSDQQVLDFIVARYGDFVLLKPPLKTETILLWLSPLLVLVGGIVLVLRSTRVRTDEAATASATLSDAERDRLNRILGEDATDNQRS